MDCNYYLLAHKDGEAYYWRPDIRDAETMKKECSRLEEFPNVKSVNYYNMEGDAHLEDYNNWSYALYNRKMVFKNQDFIMHFGNINQFAPIGYIVLVRTNVNSNGTVQNILTRGALTEGIKSIKPNELMNMLSPEQQRYIYNQMRMDSIAKDAVCRIHDAYSDIINGRTDEDLREEIGNQVAIYWVEHNNYDCNRDYWSNIDSLIEEIIF